MDKPTEPHGTLYCFSPECYTRIRYFKETSLDLLKRARELIEGLTPAHQVDLKSLQHVIEEASESLQLQIRLLVVGEDVFQAATFVQNAVKADGDLLYDCKEKGFGKEFDFVLYPVKTTAMVKSEALIAIHKDIGHENFVRGLIPFESNTSHKQHELNLDIIRLPVLMKQILSEKEYRKFSQKLCPIAELPRKISIRVERRLLENIKHLEEKLQCLQEHLQQFPTTEVEEIIKSMFRGRRLTEGLTVEFKDMKNGERSVACQHKPSDHTCCQCFVLEKTSIALGNLIEQAVHYKLLFPRSTEKKSRIGSIDKTGSELTNTIRDFLFQTAHSSRVLAVEKFSNMPVARYYAIKITHIGRDTFCSMREEVECLRFQIGSILSQSLISEFKNFSRDHLEKTLPDEIRNELFDT